MVISVLYECISRPKKCIFTFNLALVKVLNLEKTSRVRKGNLIYEYCGGQYSRKEAMEVGGIGVGGLKYLDGATKVDEIKRRSYLRSNTETLRDGLGFYLRDEQGNYMLLLHNTEILSISFDKSPDEIRRRDKFSWFQWCLDKGIAYHNARLMLMEDEIVKLNPTTLKVITHGLDEINFECHRRNPHPVGEYFANSRYADKFSSDYQTFTFVD